MNEDFKSIFRKALSNTSNTLLDVQDVATVLGCSTQTVYNLIKAGKLNAIQHTKKARYKFKPEDIEDYLDQNKITNNPIDEYYRE